MSRQPRCPWRRGLSAMAGLILLSACSTAPEPPVSQAVPPPPPDQLVLTPIGYELLPGWLADNQVDALPALRRSCEHIALLPPGQPIGQDGRGGLAADWLAPCGALRWLADGDQAAARLYFETWFQPFRAANGTRTDGLFTGYYQAELHGSLHRGGVFQIPLYGRPPGLPADPGAAGQPYYSRAEIEAGALAGKVPELLWVDDPVDAHILHIQGSGRVILDDGTVVQVGFNGSNGQKFVGLGRILLDHGKISAGDTTMQTVRAWLKAHPDEAATLMAENPRYVFFRFINGEGPVGAAGIPLTPGRSLAVDPRFIPLGVPLWLDTLEPDGSPLQRVMIAQDSGAAIKGPVRGDVYWGTGEDAFAKAGRMKSRGTYYLLLPRQRSGPVAAAEVSSGQL